jgi:hypothetical protein
MSQLLEIRKLPDGRVQARRKDGQPLTDKDRQKVRRLATTTKPETTPEPDDDPLLRVEQWYPEFHRLHMAVVAETPDFDYGWLRQHRPDLYQRIKDKENAIDALETVRLSEIMAIMTEWRWLMMDAEFQRADSVRHEMADTDGAIEAELEKEPARS